MIEVVPFDPEHLTKIAPRECHSGEIIGVVQTPAMTFMLGSDPIAIVGWNSQDPGLIQAWGIFSDGVKKRPIEFVKAVRLLVEYAFEEMNARRIHIAVKQGFAAGWRFACALGFSCEGTMKHFGPDGSDYWMFARTRWPLHSHS